MIHYHGGPIWPEQAGAIIWKGKHGFVSFARPEQIGVVAEACQSFALDNGSFTAWRQKKEYNFNGYFNWVKQWMFHPGFDFCLIPDKIDGSEEENFELIKNWKFSKFISVPVWHLHESLEYLHLLASSFPRIALGSSGDYKIVGNLKWHDRMYEVMQTICNNGKPICKIHGLRMLNPKVFTKYPFASADSTNVAQNCRETKHWHGTYKPANNTSRGCLLVDRIETFNSNSLWKPFIKKIM